MQETRSSCLLDLATSWFQFHLGLGLPWPPCFDCPRVVAERMLSSPFTGKMLEKVLVTEVMFASNSTLGGEA